MEFLTALAHGLLAADPDGPTPVLVGVPMAELDDWVPGHAGFDAAMAGAVAAGRPGLLIVPAGSEMPS